MDLYPRLEQATKNSCRQKDYINMNIEQCVELQKSRFMLQTFLDSFNMESFDWRPEGKQGKGDY